MGYHNIPKLVLNENELTIVPYTRQKLAEYLSFFSNTDLDEVLKKSHLAYFESYFKRFKVKKIYC